MIVWWARLPTVRWTRAFPSPSTESLVFGIRLSVVRVSTCRPAADTVTRLTLICVTRVVNRGPLSSGWLPVIRLWVTCPSVVRFVAVKFMFVTPACLRASRHPVQA